MTIDIRPIAEEKANAPNCFALFAQKVIDFYRRLIEAHRSLAENKKDRRRPSAKTQQRRW